MTTPFTIPKFPKKHGVEDAASSSAGVNSRRDAPGDKTQQRSARIGFAGRTGAERLVAMPLPIKELIEREGAELVDEIKQTFKACYNQLPARLVKSLPPTDNAKGYATALRVVIKEAASLCDMTVEAYLGTTLMDVDEKDEYGQAIKFDLMTVNEVLVAKWVADGKPVCSECGMKHPPPHNRTRANAYFKKKDEEHARKQRNIAAAQAAWDKSNTKKSNEKSFGQKRKRDKMEASLAYGRGQRLYADAIVAKIAENEKAARESAGKAMEADRSILERVRQMRAEEPEDDDEEFEADEPAPAKGVPLGDLPVRTKKKAKSSKE